MLLVKSWISQDFEELAPLGLEVLQHRKQLELKWGLPKGLGAVVRSSCSVALRE